MNIRKEIVGIEGDFSVTMTYGNSSDVPFAYWKYRISNMFKGNTFVVSEGFVFREVSDEMISKIAKGVAKNLMEIKNGNSDV